MFYQSSEQNCITSLNYLNKDILFFNGTIIEYDIPAAYPNILKNGNCVFKNNYHLTKLIKEFNGYENQKHKDNILISIGKEMRNNPNLSKYLNDNLLNILIEFQLKNNLTKENIFSIKKDALFINKKCNITEFNNIKFIEKNRYNCYFYDFESNYEYYIDYKFNNIKYSIKGLGKDYDKKIYNKISKIISITLNNNKIDLIRDVQKKLLYTDKIDIELIKEYLPEYILFNNMVYIPLDDYINKQEITKDFLINVYDKYYKKPLSCLIKLII